MCFHGDEEFEGLAQAGVIMRSRVLVMIKGQDAIFFLINMKPT